MLNHLRPLAKYPYSIASAILLTVLFFLYERGTVFGVYRVGFAYLLFFFVAEIERSFILSRKKKICLGVILSSFLALYFLAPFLPAWPMFIIILQLIVIFGFHKVLLSESDSDAIHWQNQVLQTFTESAIGSISALAAIYLLIFLTGFVLDQKFETWIPLKLAFTVIPCFIYLIRNDTRREFSKFTDGLLKFVLCPLWIIYVAFLNLYALKILLSWNLPNGMVAIPTGIVFALCLALWWISKMGSFTIPYEKWLFYLHVPVFVLFFVGLAKRISDYGITQARYLLILAALLFASFLISKIRGYLTGKTFAIRIIIVLFLGMIKVSDVLPSLFPQSDLLFQSDHEE